MPNHQVLDNINHQHLRVITAHKTEFGDVASYSNVFVSEFRHAQADYPILFRKNTETAEFEAICMFGFAAQENLFLDNQGWHASYIPLSIERQPFLIGLQHGDQPGQNEPQAMVNIDMDSPRVSQTEGELLFLEQGGQSPYLQRISSVLKAIHQGHSETKAFIDELIKNDLLESVAINVTLNDGSHHELASLYTINEDKLKQLSSDRVFEFHQSGYLQHIYMIMGSMSNMSKLIELKNQSL
ncbi:MAG: hypothetical protein ACI81A_000154 [Paraglaciecola sp.]|jgi:hypothetical protein